MIKRGVVTFVVTRMGGVKQKTANSLRISGLWWCHQYCLYLYSCMVINYIHSISRWIISSAPLISYGIMGILHIEIYVLIPLADSQSSLFLMQN